MQLQLIPFPPHPAILFAFTLPALPPTLPFPPPSPYALDKAVWAVHLIEIVTFDLPKRKVHVKMVDDSVIEWEMRGEEPWLKRVQENVEKSTKEAERERNEELNAAAASSVANPYLPLTNPPLCPPELEREVTSNSRSHRRSKSLFNSLLSALSIGSYTPSGTQPYRIGGGGGGSGRKDRFETSAEHLASTIRAFSISSLSTSEFTYPPRAQLRQVSSPASRILRRNARSALVDCFRRWVVPTVRDRLRWGAFIPYDEDLETGLDETKWGKMSKATNAYADWACRSKIRRCESTLKDALALVASPTEESGMRHEVISDKDSRRSSASSTLASAISASSRASSSHHEQPSPDGEFDEFPESILAATLKTPRPAALNNLTGPYTPISGRHVSALQSIITKFKTLHDMLGADARGMAEGHNLALRALEERGRRRGWSSMESGGIRKSRLCISNAEYGSGSSAWELSIPVVRSALGEISSTWEDWQMEWEMEREFEHDEIEDFNVDDFPDVVSEFETGPFRSDIELNGHGRNPSLTATEIDLNDAECHSEFSDSSDEGELSTVNETSPTSPSDFATLQQLSSSDPNLELTSASIVKAHRGRRSGVQARLGTYEDVRDEMPPSPPLVALSPPPARLRTGKENAEGTSTTEPRANASASRPPRGLKPLKMQPLANRATSHRREGATSEHAQGNFAQTRVGDVQSGVFDEWEEDTEAGDVFGPINHPSLEPRRFLGSLRDALESRINDDGGVSVLEQVGASSEVASGHVYPPGLHGDYPWGAHPPSPTRKVLAVSPRRRDFAELAVDDAREALVMDKLPSARSPRLKPHLTLSLSAISKPLSAPMTDSHLGQAHVPVTIIQEARPAPLSAPAHVSSFEDKVQEEPRTLEGPPKEDAPALLLDTPTVEHPTSTYPYTWDISVVPRGMVVVGRVGVAEDDAASTMTTTTTTTSEKSSSSGKLAKQPSKLRKPNPNAKPILCVTPPPPVPPLPSKEEQARLVRSKSWKGLLSRSEKDTLQVSSEGKLVKRRRRSAEPLASSTPKKTKEASEQRSLMSSTSSESLDSVDSDDLGEVVVSTETYHIPDAWFTISEPKVVTRKSCTSVNLSAPEPERRPTRTKSMGTLNRPPSFIEIDPAMAPAIPPPPRPAKSLKRSRSVGHMVAES